MSFPAGKTLAILLIVIIMISTQSTAIRIYPPEKSQTQKFREYFHTRISDLNNATAANATYDDYKRKIPSCPDPLHN
ncbi:hypothetical protein SASPL_151411 [Salvia splendens]|uniref:CLAVATA3/ESR (CLE)-related protein 9 n=1 Tax=Salvia splendens TaxID=180675 RepID=A0A8X8Z2Z0_SALSN|nr:hypothetical protein SASPL_151411 [Salvia splendens]